MGESFVVDTGGIGTGRRSSAGNGDGGTTNFEPRGGGGGGGGRLSVVLRSEDDVDVLRFNASAGVPSTCELEVARRRVLEGSVTVNDSPAAAGRTVDVSDANRSNLDLRLLTACKDPSSMSADSIPIGAGRSALSSCTSREPGSFGLPVVRQGM